MTATPVVDVGPYARAAHLYRDAGWTGTVPIPARAKKIRVSGYTGAAGVDPSAADVLAWIVGAQSHGNIALRLPENVLGIDVDHYGNKTGGDTLASAEITYGLLPPTWRTTSRADGVNGIRLYRVPAGMAWTSPGAGIDMIHHGWRYAMVWPSVHPTGAVYRWIDPDGNTGTPPRPDDLPELPSAWIDGLTGGALAVTHDGAGLDAGQVRGWIATYGQGDPCRVVAGHVRRACDGLLVPGVVRHDAMLKAAYALAMFAAEGHPGVNAALAELHAVWIEHVVGDPARERDPGEWDRSLTRAIDLAAARGTVPEHDPCDALHAFDGLLGPGYALPSTAVEPAAVDAETPARLGAVSVRLADVMAERVDWLWRDRLPLGKLVVLDGDPGGGKSTLSTDWAARVSTGRAWPDGSPCRVGDVLLLSAEDGLADTIRPRLDAARGDPTRVHALTEIRYRDDKGVIRSRPVTLADIDAIKARVTATSARLVVIDVLMAYLPGKVDSHRDQDIRAVLSAVAAMAESTGCCVLLLRHLNKSAGGSAIYRGGGSIGIIGAARVGLLVAPDPDDETRRVLAATKNNLAAMPDALGYRLIDSPENGCARVEWLGASVHTAQTLLSVAADDDDGRETSDWLITYLEDSPARSAPAAEVLAAARKAGLNESTVKKTRARHKISSTRVGFGQRAAYIWALPPHGIPMESMESSTQSEDSMDSMDSMDADNPPAAGGLAEPCDQSTTTEKEIST